MADVGDIVRMAMIYSSPGASEQQNVFHWIIEDVGIGNPNLLAELATWTTDIWAPAWQFLAGNNSTLVEISVDIMNPDGTVKINVGVEDIGVTGDGLASTTSAAVSGYLLAQTALPKSRGSKYIPGIDDAQINNGLFEPDALIELAILAALYVTSVNTGIGATLVPGLLSRTLQQFVPFITDASTTDVPAYQRRRKPNIGS